jgi:CHAT domain-containing protein/tetratricopeptide (TPR) repeat protein
MKLAGGAVCLAAAAALLPVDPAPQTPAPAVQSIEHVRASLESGAYDEAESLARQLHASVAATYPSDSIELSRAGDVLVEALIRNGRGGEAGTLALAESIQRAKENRADPDDLEVARSVYNLGWVRLERGEFSRALDLYERSLALRVKRLPADASLIADTHDQIGLALIRIERFDAAQHTLLRAQTIRESRAASEPLRLAQTLELIGWLHRYAGDFGAAQRVVDRVLDLRRRLSPEHPDLASAVQLAGDVAWHEGQIDRARALWEEGLTLLERRVGVDHPGVIGFERRLALASDARGDRSETRLLLDRATHIAERRLAECSPELLAVRVQSAQSLMYDGNYTGARRTSEQALAACERCLGADHSRTATVMHNIGLLEHEMGNESDAKRLQARAVSIWSRSLGRDHLYVARGLDSLAEVADAQGHLDEARRLYLRALTIRRRNNAAHPDVAWTLTNLARLSARIGRIDEAGRYVADAIRIYTKAGAADEPDHLARVFMLRGELEALRGNVRAARSSFAEALSARERIFGPMHPLSAESLARVAAADLVADAVPSALDEALRAEQVARQHVQFTVRYLPERQAIAYASKRSRALDVALSVAASNAAIGHARAFDELIKSRSVTLDEFVARARQITTQDPDAEVLFAAVTKARQRMANLIVKSLDEPVDRRLLTEAREQKEEAERSLAAHGVDASAEMRRTQIGFNEIQAALAPDSALVSYVEYDRTLRQRPAGRSALASVRSFAAFVYVAGAAEPRFVPLGPADGIDERIRGWRAATSSPPNASNTDYRITGVALRRSVWDPVEPYTRQATRVFIVADGLLNIVNFGALPGAGRRFLVEGDSIFHYLSAERDIVSPPSQSLGSGLLAVGGPAFDNRPKVVNGPSIATRSTCNDLGGIKFAPLPGSRREVAEISKVWTPSTAGAAQVLSGAAATETAVKQHLQGRRTIHFATHGFFLGPDCRSAVAGTRSVGGLAKRASRPAVQVENPLLLSGLAFAGANERRNVRPDQDDGILTAEEIAGLNLQGTEWAVLSACDTGLGEIKAGEGVFGLRRAFQIAGARTVIMSLWSVEDRSAMEWMRALYQGRLQRGLDTAEAVREASLTVLRQRRTKGQSTHPFYWAGFVASGDWR